MLLAYDEHGHCPMLVDDRCSIYEHRPRACRTYDCRVLPAAGLDIGTEPGKERIARRTRRWRFSYPSATDRAERDAVHAAAAFLQTHAAELPANVRPANTTQLAVLAVELHDMFLPRDTDSGQDSAGAPDPDAVRVELTRTDTRQDLIAPGRRGRGHPGLTRPDRSRSSRCCPRDPSP